MTKIEFIADMLTKFTIKYCFNTVSETATKAYRKLKSALI